MNTDSFFIIVPHFGSDEHLRRLLASLRVSFPADLSKTRMLVAPFSNGTIVVVNNNLENRGFTAGCNEGIRYAIGEGAEAVWLLNNDAVVPDLGGALQAFKGEFTENKRTGVIGCKILSLQDPDFIHHGGTAEAFPHGSHKQGLVSRGDYSHRTKERWVTGASFVISRECLLRVGMLDEGFFNYGSDSDYCYSARRAGFDVVYLPVPVLHLFGGGEGSTPLRTESLRRDMEYFEAKWVTGALFRRLDTDPL